MELRIVRRGLTALVIAAVLGLAGAYPASATELGWVERSLSWLSRLWSLEDSASGRPGEGLLSTLSTADKGYGVDPNGETTPPPPPPVETR